MTTLKVVIFINMIIGGAYQGKRAFAREYFGINNMLDGRICDYDEIFGAECVFNFHMLIKRLVDENIDCVEFTQKIIDENSDIVIITDEIGCGIIPLEKSERIWRENAGKCGCMIAASSEKVIRVFCGILTVIKNTAPPHTTADKERI
ncbi:MAG: bifunctional adenosylcobinamide kinase/adenosylcobinamide-phosphate guanylyltransferase [Ruminococcus sp.]|nr:bifunctional adenosylcobinamide kinase/adenosylcobinamide-phosphate guanylyltransferase [Ruminococcus sp.]